jgi:hypothetical protein
LCHECGRVYEGTSHSFLGLRSSVEHSLDALLVERVSFLLLELLLVGLLLGEHSFGRVTGLGDCGVDGFAYGSGGTDQGGDHNRS